MNARLLTKHGRSFSKAFRLVELQEICHMAGLEDRLFKQGGERCATWQVSEISFSNRGGGKMCNMAGFEDRLFKQGG